MRQHAPVHVILYSPKDEDNKRALTRKIAQIHGDAVNRQINELNCPAEQKQQLLDAIIAASKHPER